MCCCSRLRRRRPPPQCPRARGQNQSYIMSWFSRAYKTCITPWHDRPAFQPALLCCRFEPRPSCPRGATRIARVCDCDKTRSRSERRCFCCRGRAATSRLFWRRCSAVSRRARWRRRGVGAAINRAPAASGARAATDMTVGDGVSSCREGGGCPGRRQSGRGPAHQRKPRHQAWRGVLSLRRSARPTLTPRPCLCM